jgi:hypothetical protein
MQIFGVVAMSVNFSEVSDKLNTVSDHMTSYYATVEARIEQASLGVDAWVPLLPGVELGYAKCGGAWQLCIRRNESFVEPLHNTTRTMRMLAVSKVNALEHKLVQNADELADKIQSILEGDITC